MCNNIVFTITTALYAGSVYHVLHIMLNIIPTLYEGYIVSVHRMVMENRPVDPGSIQRSHRTILRSILYQDSNFELVFVSRNPPDSTKEICYGDLVTEIL